MSESKNVTTLTVMKMVDMPIANCLFFFLKSFVTYEILVRTIAEKESAAFMNA